MGSHLATHHVCGLDDRNQFIIEELL